MTSSAFKAPWGRALRICSAVLSLISVGAAIALLPDFTAGQKTPPPAWLGPLAVALVFVSALFTIRGYEVRDGTLLVQRLFWTTRVPLTGLLSAMLERNAMRGSIRTCGNGGMFSFSGWWWSKRLGRFRAFVTDLKETVVLRFADRTIVVSPEFPEEFAAQALRHARESEAGIWTSPERGTR